ncbi:MAG: hypothetical protein J2P50_19470, partial [Hyphomicrobiaceae bacterium]|nr:hypothetical protein [Hyphomicrobiaceae bacterium]
MAHEGNTRNDTARRVPEPGHDDAGAGRTKTGLSRLELDRSASAAPTPPEPLPRFTPPHVTPS